jgi:hypothetical protein
MQKIDISFAEITHRDSHNQQSSTDVLRIVFWVCILRRRIMVVKEWDAEENVCA